MPPGFLRILLSAVVVGYLLSGPGARAVSPGGANAYTYRLGFDTETAPSVSEMQYSWAHYGYFYVGAYISGGPDEFNQTGRQGDNRAAQPNLSFDWVSQVDDTFFGFLPIDLGWQAPAGCELVGQPAMWRMSSDPSTAYNQGVQEAVVASRSARNLGLSGQSPIYLDMEAYNTQNSVCRTAVLEFIHGWLVQMKQYEGRIAGVYGSSAGSDVQSWSTITPPPDDIWFADNCASSEQDPCISVWSSPYISNTSWSIQPPYGRFHQFRLDIPNIWFGDVYKSIDQNCAWGVVAGKGYSTSDSRYPYCPGSRP